MNFQQLRYFKVLCEKGSFGKAADVLSITQQGLSMAISSLENEFSARFFLRTTKGVTLTEEGKYFLGKAEIFLEQYKDCIDYFAVKNKEDLLVRVAACQGAISEFGAEALKEFSTLNDKIKIQIREFNDKMVDNVVLRDDAVIGFGLEPMDTELFHCERVHSSKYVLLINEKDPLAQYDVIPAALLPKLNLITVDETFKSSEKFLSICSELGYNITPSFRVGEITAVHRLVRRNMGVGLSIDTVAEELSTPETVFRPFDSNLFSWSIDIFKRKNVELSKSAQTFFDFIVNRKNQP